MLPQTLHTFKTGDTFTAAQVEGDTFVIASTRNEEHAAEGRFLNLVTVIPLQEAIAIAKMILASQEDTALDAHIEEQFKRRQDHLALVDSALEHDIRF